MYYDNEARAARDGDPGLPWNPFKAVVAPRPIGWVTTLTSTGTVNLAPFSYFQAVADRPDVVVFSVASATLKADGVPTITQDRKDSDVNAAAGGEFVCNLATDSLRDAVNQTSLALRPDQSEVDLANVEMTPSLRVGPPRVAASPAALECVVVGVLPVPHRGGDHRFRLVFGEVLGTYLADEYVDADGRVDTAAMGVLTRLGYDEYAVLDRVFRMSRPDLDPMSDGLVR